MWDREDQFDKISIGKVKQQLCTLFLSCLPLFSSLDPEQKDYLIEVIEKLLKDKTTVKNFDCL